MTPIREAEPRLLGTIHNRWDLWSNGKVLPVIRGAEEETDEQRQAREEKERKAEEDRLKKEEADKERRFSQDDLTRIATREKDEGRKAAVKDIMKKLGVETAEEAEEIIKRAREAADKGKSESEKAKAEADKAKAAAEQDRAEAKREKYAARVERALIRAGVPDDDSKLAKVARLVDAEEDDDLDKIKDAVEATKKEFPELFSGKTSEEDKSGKGKPPPPPGKPRPGSSQERAKELVQSRHGSRIAARDKT